MLGLGKTTSGEEETSCDATRSRTSFLVASPGMPAPWSLCLLNQAGAIVLHRHMPAGPAPFRKAMAPDREDLGVGVACLFTWSWLADLGAREGRPLVRGHALSMPAIHGGKATNAPLEAQTMAVWLRGGRLPQAYVSPADRRATRDRLRRRIHWRRTRAALRGPIPQTNRPYHLPDRGQKIADTATRDGVAERCAEPAGHKRIAVDLALMGPDDERLRDRERSILQAAPPHDANTLSLLRTRPGMGELLRLVLLDALPAIQRFPRVHDVVASWRLVTCAKEAAGTRSGPAGTKLGHASLRWAFAEAAVFCLRHHPPGQKLRVRLENTQGKGKALTVLAPQLARAVYHRFTCESAVDRQHCLQRASGAARMSPVPNGPIADGAWSACAVVPLARRRERCRAQRPLPLSPALCLDIRSGAAP
jgi:transposase